MLRNLSGKQIMLKIALARIQETLRSRNKKARHRPGRSQQPEVLESRMLLAATAIQTVQRSGQTFITWNEDTSVSGEQYNVYRSSSPITTANLSNATKLTYKWGALADNTSENVRAQTSEGVPANFVITDLGTPLTDDTGLFVYTTPIGGAGNWYYAVTQVNQGVEDRTLSSGNNSLSSAVAESVATPQPVLTISNVSRNGRIYTQYMDYAKWNPTFQGYAYNYSVALPSNYDPGIAWPLKVMPHAYGERMRMEQQAEFDWQCIEVFPDDPGGGIPGDHFQTWWYGFAADHNYKTDGAFPTSGHVENFTEQRLLKMIEEVSTIFNVDQQRIQSQGHSMGASGSVSLGMRYGNVFSGIFASEPMTNYPASPLFQTDYSVLWGSQALNLPIVNNGPYATPMKQYDGVGVYNWMNHVEQLTNRRGEPMAFMMVGHGKADDVIDWATQGRPFIAALNAGSAGYTAEQRLGWDHNWMSFDFALDSMFSPEIGGLGKWTYPKNMSYPSIANATGSGPQDPGTTATNFYNMTIEWSVPWNHFTTDIVDTSNRYEMALRSTTVAQLAEVTPQRLQAFRMLPGAVIAWQNINVSTGDTVQSGTLVADADGLVTVSRMQIGTGTGNRLILTQNEQRPVISGPAATTTSQTPQVTWSATTGTSSYDVWITNVSTGQNPVLQANVTTSSFTPASPLGIGKYRVWVRSKFVGGITSGWSAPRDFQITSAPTINTLVSPVTVNSPQLTWTNLPGAAKYDLWLDNLTTGQTQVIRNANITSNSYQLTTNLGVGLYKVWVRGIDVAGNAATWSAPSAFTVAGVVSATGPNGPTFTNRPVFQWTALPGANRYEIVIRNRATGATVTNPTTITTTTWTPTTALVNSDYRWWIRGFTSTGIAGTWNAPVDFNVGGKPTLLTPQGTTTNRTPTFTWTAVQGAARYELLVSKADGSGSVISVTNLTTASFTPTTSLLPRVYRVWVRAVSTTNVISAWSTPVDVTITKFDEMTEDHQLAELPPKEVFPLKSKEASAKATNRQTAATTNVLAAAEEFTPADPQIEQPKEPGVIRDQPNAIDHVMANWSTI